MGRGAEDDDRYAGKAGRFERMGEEAQEDDVFEAFAEFGDIKNLHLNLDRRTGFVKGYAFIEYETRGEAEKAIRGMNSEVLLDQKLAVQWAFAKPGGQRRRRR